MITTTTKKRTITLAALARRNRVICLTVHLERGGHIDVSGLCRRIGEHVWIGSACLPSDTVVERPACGGPEWVVYRS